MKKIFAFFVLAILFASGCTQGPEPIIEPEQITHGTLKISMTDQPSEVSEYKELNVKISGIEVHKFSGEWVKFFDEEKEFNLFELNGVKELFGEKELEAGRYTGIKLNVDSAELVEEENGEEETYTVKVPSEKIQLSKNFEIINGRDLELVIDFDPYSVVVEANEYILKPNIKILTVAEFDEKVKKEKKMKDEQELENEQVKIQQIIFPQNAVIGETVEFRWVVFSGKEKEVTHTAIHWDLTGGHGEDFEAYANASEIKQGKTKEEFFARIKMPEVPQNKPTPFFFRVHAIVEGKQVYSDELKITLSPEQAVQTQVKEFEVLSNDIEFVPAQLSARQGDTVKIKFTVDTSKISFGGERIKSDFFDITRLPPGESQTVEFTMPDKDITIRSFWPSTSIFKASMKIVVDKS